MKKFKLVFLCLCICLSVAFAEPVSFIASGLTATEELEALIAENNAEIEANRALLEALRAEKESQQEYLETLELQIDAISEKATNIQTQKENINKSINSLNDELNQLNNEVETLNEEIEVYKKEIVALENSISSASELLSAKLRSAFVNGYESTLTILLGSDSLSSFLTRLEFMKRTSENDKKMILGFRDQVQQCNEAKSSLEADKVELVSKQKEIKEKKLEYEANVTALEEAEAEFQATMDELEGQYAEIELVLAQLDKTGAEYQEYINRLEEENAQADAEIDRILSEYYATSVQQTTTRLDASNADPAVTAGPSYVGTGDWYWPIGDRWCYISSGFGYRDPNVSGWSFHGGIDLAGGNGALHGAPVYATKSGTVITAVTSDVGYGVYVMIDHGEGYVSLYGHMSTRYVSAGDFVIQGQMIGRVGNTGNSKGAHLHFEIRYFGEKKDPLNYVKQP